MSERHFQRYGTVMRPNTLSDSTQPLFMRMMSTTPRRKHGGCGISAARARKRLETEPAAASTGLGRTTQPDATPTNSVKAPAAVRIPNLASELVATSDEGSQPNSSIEQQRLQRLEKLLELMVAKVFYFSTRLCPPVAPKRLSLIHI